MDSTYAIGMVVVALTAILGLGAIIFKPLTNAVKAITELTVSVKNLTDKFGTFETNSHDTHKRLWDKNSEQDKRLNDHNTRICILEGHIDE